MSENAACRFCEGYGRVGADTPLQDTVRCVECDGTGRAATPNERRSLMAEPTPDRKREHPLGPTEAQYAKALREALKDAVDALTLHHFEAVVPTAAIEAAIDAALADAATDGTPVEPTPQERAEAFRKLLASWKEPYPGYDAEVLAALEESRTPAQPVEPVAWGWAIVTGESQVITVRDSLEKAQESKRFYDTTRIVVRIEPLYPHPPKEPSDA